MKRVILDANVVIQLHALGIWKQFLSSAQKKGWELLVGDTVCEEAVYFLHEDKEEQIDLSADFQNGFLKSFRISSSEAKKFLASFDPLYAPELHLGETECLVFLVQHQKDSLLCSADGAVFRTLGLLHLEEYGVSLEELLQQIGFGRRVLYQYSRAFRQNYTKEGQKDFLQGRGLK